MPRHIQNKADKFKKKKKKKQEKKEKRKTEDPCAEIFNGHQWRGLLSSTTRSVPTTFVFSVQPITVISAEDLVSRREEDVGGVSSKSKNNVANITPS